MTPKINQLLDVPDNIINDIETRIESSTADILKSGKTDIPYCQFWFRFLTANDLAGVIYKTPKGCFISPKAKGKDISDALHKAFAYAIPFMSTFYRTDYKCGKNLRFPSPCQYEVRIPYEQKNPSGINYFITPFGVKPKDIAFVLALSLPTRLTHTASAHIKGTINVNQGKLSVSRQRVPNMVEAMVKYTSDFVPPNAPRIEWGPIQLNNKPCLTFPCYNIPLKVAYEMARDDMGDFQFDQGSIWSYVNEEKVRSLTLYRKPMDPTMFYATNNWAFWEMFGLSEAERMDQLNSDLALCKLPLYKGSQASLRIRCMRLFKDHIASRSPRRISK